MEDVCTVLMACTSDGIVVVEGGIIRLANEKFAQMVGHSVDHLVRQYLTKVIAPDSLDLIEQRYRSIVLGRKVPSAYSIDLLTTDGRTVTVDANATFVQLDGGVAELVTLREVDKNNLPEHMPKES